MPLKPWSDPCCDEHPPDWRSFVKGHDYSSVYQASCCPCLCTSVCGTVDAGFLTTRHMSGVLDCAIMMFYHPYEYVRCNVSAPMSRVLDDNARRSQRPVCIRGSDQGLCCLPFNSTTVWSMIQSPVRDHT